jgi:hypothetical protein
MATPKKAGVAILISDKVDFKLSWSEKTKKVRGNNNC